MSSFRWRSRLGATFSRFRQHCCRSLISTPSAPPSSPPRQLPGTPIFRLASRQSLSITVALAPPTGRGCQALEAEMQRRRNPRCIPVGKSLQGMVLLGHLYVAIDFASFQHRSRHEALARLNNALDLAQPSSFAPEHLGSHAFAPRNVSRKRTTLALPGWFTMILILPGPSLNPFFD